jgi:hypothetical protein
MGQLRDHTLVAARTRRPVGGLALFHAVCHVAQRIVELNGVAQQRFAPHQGQLGGGVPVEVQHVEDVVEDRYSRRQGPLGVGDAQSALEPGEAGAPSLKGHDLAVHDQPGGVLRREGIDEFRVGRVE